MLIETSLLIYTFIIYPFYNVNLPKYFNPSTFIFYLLIYITYQYINFFFLSFLFLIHYPLYLFSSQFYQNLPQNSSSDEKKIPSSPITNFLSNFKKYVQNYSRERNSPYYRMDRASRMINSTEVIRHSYNNINSNNSWTENIGHGIMAGLGAWILYNDISDLLDEFDGYYNKFKSEHQDEFDEYVEKDKDLSPMEILQKENIYHPEISELKKKYRAWLLENHPDKIIGFSELNEGEQKKINEKCIRVMNAYKKIIG